MDFYNRLGVDKTASKDEIKKAYRKLSLQYHPDKNPDRVEESKKRFQEITEAFETLSDDDKRRAYDNRGNMPFGMNMNPNMNPNINIFDIFNQFGMFKDKEERPNLDINLPARMSLATSYRGEHVNHTIKVRRLCESCKHTGYEDFVDHNCKHCKNTGFIHKTVSMGFMTQQFRANCNQCTPGKFNDIKCRTCNGSRTVDADFTISVTIPAGIKNGQVITLNSDGNHNVFEGNIIKGDINLSIQIDPDENFSRVDNDLHSTLTINLKEALCGFSRQFQNIDGSYIQVTNTNVLNTDDTITINEKGFIYDGNHRGNLCLKIKVERYYRVFSETERQILENIL